MFAGYAEGQSAAHVETEAELREAISNAAVGVPVVIILDKEIGLTGTTLTIPANKDITLRSNGNAEFELFGVSGTGTITVENRGVLTLAGITVTHASGATGWGVGVNSGGKLTMTGGKISGNSYYGVSNSGDFTMSGGMISNNGDGVSAPSYSSNFTMTGGEISNNGRGVYVVANFNMTYGKISGNTGVGVSVDGGTFTMTGGEISNNGRGVDNSRVFLMLGGKISGNTLSGNGGGVSNTGTFTMSGGEISGNTVTGNYNGGNGGGVYNTGTFTLSGGEISKNTAQNGGGVYVEWGSFNLYGGKITGNTATRNGGGVWVTDTVINFNRLTVRDGVVFSDNRALAAYNRDSAHDSTYRAYIENNVKWSEPFTQGYNNFDISYVYGTSITRFTVIVQDCYGTPTGAGSYSAGDTVTLNAGTRTGYTFARWTVNDGVVSLSSTTSTTATFTMPTNNVVVNAIWTASATGDSGGSGSSSNSGGSGGSGGSSNSGNSGGSGSSDNNKQPNEADNSIGSNDNEQHTIYDEPANISTAGLVGTVIMMTGWIIGSLAIFARMRGRELKKINKDQKNIKKNPGFGSFYLYLLPTLGLYTVYIESISVAKLNIMFKNKLGGDAQVSFPSTLFAIFWAVFLLPVIFFISFAVVNGLLLNTAAHAVIFNLNFASFGTTFIDGMVMRGGISLFSALTPVFFGWVVVVLLLALVSILYLNGHAHNITKGLIKLAGCYDRDDIQETLYRHDNSGISGLSLRISQNAYKFEELLPYYNSDITNRFKGY
jgi:uncharacterized repeat protein (TIGR02543 family)